MRLKPEDLKATSPPGTRKQLDEILNVLIGDAQIEQQARDQLRMQVRFFARQFLDGLRRAIISPALSEEINTWRRIEHLAASLHSAIRESDKALLDSNSRLLGLSLTEIVGVDVEGNTLLRGETFVRSRIAAELLDLDLAYCKHPLEILSRQAREQRRSLEDCHSGGARTGPERLHSRLSHDPRSWLAATVTFWLRRMRWSPHDRGAAGRLLEAMSLIFAFATGIDPIQLHVASDLRSGVGRNAKLSADLARYRDAEMQASRLIDLQKKLPRHFWGCDPEWLTLETKIEDIRSGASRKRSRNSTKKRGNCE